MSNVICPHCHDEVPSDALCSSCREPLEGTSPATSVKRESTEPNTASENTPDQSVTDGLLSRGISVARAYRVALIVIMTVFVCLLVASVLIQQNERISALETDAMLLWMKAPAAVEVDVPTSDERPQSDQTPAGKSIIVTDILQLFEELPDYVLPGNTEDLRSVWERIHSRAASQWLQDKLSNAIYSASLEFDRAYLEDEYIEVNMSGHVGYRGIPLEIDVEAKYPKEDLAIFTKYKRGDHIEFQGRIDRVWLSGHYNISLGGVYSLTLHLRFSEASIGKDSEVKNE